MTHKEALAQLVLELETLTEQAHNLILAEELDFDWQLGIRAGRARAYHTALRAAREYMEQAKD